MEIDNSISNEEKSNEEVSETPSVVSEPEVNINDIFQVANNNVKEAANIFHKNIEMKKELRRKTSKIRINLIAEHEEKKQLI